MARAIASHGLVEQHAFHRSAGGIPLSARTWSLGLGLAIFYEVDWVGVSSCDAGNDPVTSRLGNGVPDWLGHHQSVGQLDQRLLTSLGVMVYHCMHGTAPKCLCDLCTLVADVASRRQLRSASQNILLVPRYKRSGLGRRHTCLVLLDRWSGTLSRTVCVIQHLNLPV